MMRAAPPGPGAGDTMFEWSWLLLGPAVLAVAFGVWMTRGRRDDVEEERRTQRLEVLAGKQHAMSMLWRARDWRMGLREPTQMGVGVSSVFLGYHVIAWVAPDRWRPLSVPQDRWWIVVLVVTCAIGGSLLMDKWQARGGEARESGGEPGYRTRDSPRELARGRCVCWKGQVSSIARTLWATVPRPRVQSGARSVRYPPCSRPGHACPAD